MLGSATGGQAQAATVTQSTASTDNPLAQNGAVDLRSTSVTAVLVVAAVMMGTLVTMV